MERPEDLILDWFIGAKDVGVTAGTSTLEETVISVSERIKAISDEMALKDRECLGKERILC